MLRAHDVPHLKEKRGFALAAHITDVEGEAQRTVVLQQQLGKLLSDLVEKGSEFGQVIDLAAHHLGYERCAKLCPKIENARVIFEAQLPRDDDVALWRFGPPTRRIRKEHRREAIREGPCPTLCGSSDGFLLADW